MVGFQIRIYFFQLMSEVLWNKLISNGLSGNFDFWEKKKYGNGKLYGGREWPSLRFAYTSFWASYAPEIDLLIVKSDVAVVVIATKNGRIEFCLFECRLWLIRNHDDFHDDQYVKAVN